MINVWSPDLGSGRKANGYQGMSAWAAWEARLEARDQELRKREEAVSTAEGQLGVRTALIMAALPHTSAP